MGLDWLLKRKPANWSHCRDPQYQTDPGRNEIHSVPGKFINCIAELGNSLSTFPEKTDNPAAEASRFPSGLHATLETQPSWPERDPSDFPLSASQSFTVLSSLPEANRFPS